MFSCSFDNHSSSMGASKSRFGWLVGLCTFVYFRMPFGTGQVDFLTVVILNVLHVLLLRATEGYLQSLFLFLGMRETLIVCAKLVIPLKP